jgi:histidinol dehydrogenase
MASVEDGPTETLVIADISRDGAYLTVPLEDAASLPAWR